MNNTLNSGPFSLFLSQRVLRTDHHGFDPLARQGENHFFLASESTLVRTGPLSFEEVAALLRSNHFYAARPSRKVDRASPQNYNRQTTSD